MFIEIKGQSVLPLTDDKEALRGLYLNPATIIAGSILILIGIGIGAGEVWLDLWNSIEVQVAFFLILGVIIPIGLGCVTILSELERRADKLLDGSFRDICVTEGDWSYGAVLTTFVQEWMRTDSDYKASVQELLRSKELKQADRDTHQARSDPTRKEKAWYARDCAMQIITSKLHGVADINVDVEFRSREAAHAALKPE